MTNRPLDFLLIGAPRCGTTSLFHYLRNHPDLFVPAAKELPFFIDDELLARGWDAFFRDYFSAAAPQQRLGKLTPHYWDRPEVPPRLHAQMPAVRLLALLRNPVDRALSHYRFLVRRGVEPRSFEDAVVDEGWKKHQHYVPLGEYGRILDQYLGCFPREQLLVLFTDELEAAPERVLFTVQTHLGLNLPFPAKNLERRYNVGGTSTRLPWLVPLVRRSPLRRLWRALPARVQGALGKWYFFEIAPKREVPPELPADLRRRLVDHFRPHIVRLEQIVGRPTPWREFRE